MSTTIKYQPCLICGDAVVESDWWFPAYRAQGYVKHGSEAAHNSFMSYDRPCRPIHVRCVSRSGAVFEPEFTGNVEVQIPDTEP